MSRQRAVYDAVTTRLDAIPAHEEFCRCAQHVDCCQADAEDCTCDIGKLRDALRLVVDVHVPGIVNHVTPCEDHEYRPGRTGYAGIRKCDACVRRPVEQCRECCSRAVCEPLAGIAAALGIDVSAVTA